MEILDGRIHEGQTIKADISGGELTFTKVLKKSHEGR